MQHLGLRGASGRQAGRSLPLGCLLCGGMGPTGPELKVLVPAADAQPWGCTCDNPSFPSFGAGPVSAGLRQGAAGVLRSREPKCGKPPSGDFLCHVLSC